MANVDTSNKGLLVRVRDLLDRKPAMNDVTFCVGPEKKKVKALKVLLIASSPVFETEFEQHWSTAVARDGEGIPLPDFDAQAFELFVKLTQLDTWGIEVLEKLNLLPDQLLNLLSICRHFQMRMASKNLEELLKIFIQYFRPKFEGDSFLRLSRSNLETILASDEIPLDEIDLFESVCRWAEHQCESKNLEPSTENMRAALGGCLFQIRFPLMSNTEFTKAIEHKRILTNDEGFEIYRFIGLEGTKKKQYDTSLLPFSFAARKTPFTVLDLTKDFKIVSNPSLVCDGNHRYLCLEPKQKIMLHGLGFLGPLDEDASYKVTIRVYDPLYSKNILDSLTKNIFARKGKMFYFNFDQPVTLDARLLDGTNRIFINHHIEGPNRPAIERAESSNSLQQIQGLEFRLEWPSGLSAGQVAEILFRKAV